MWPYVEWWELDYAERAGQLKGNDMGQMKMFLRWQMADGELSTWIHHCQAICNELMRLSLVQLDFNFNVWKTKERSNDDNC